MNKEIERASWDNTIEGYPTTPWRAIMFILWFSCIIAFFTIEFIFGADDFINWVANLIG